jgi:hypothetical protein
MSVLKLTESFLRPSTRRKVGLPFFAPQPHIYVNMTDFDDEVQSKLYVDPQCSNIYGRYANAML